MKRRIMSILLALLLMFTCIPVNPVLAAEATYNEPTLVVESKYAASGTSVEVNISVVNNPGVAGAKISVSYNDKLTLVDAVSGDTFATLDYTAPPNFTNSCYFNWDSLDTEVTEDGVLLTLVFETSSEAVANEELNVEVTYRSGDIYNINLDSVELDIVNGCITIINYIPGDINGDNVVNGKDVTLLRRYNAGYNVTINEAAADVNDDGVINGKDVTLIRRHNAGYNVELKPSTPRCSHTMETIAFKAATCTEDGNISYYHCTACDKYYNDNNGTVEIVLANTILSATGHTAVTLPAVEPTYTSPGKTEGSQCSVCKEILVAQEEIPMLEEKEYIITYKLPSSDTYLVEIGAEKTNPNPTTYTSESGVEVLEDLDVSGYDFYGWYTEPNGSGTRVSEIKKGSTGTKILYAHMTPHIYSIEFDSPDVPWETITYTVDKGTTLTNPSWFGYTFVGWSNDEGFIVTRIKPGTIGNMTLHANWTSDRNKATSYQSYGAPVIIEDDVNGQLLFVYNIGKIDNVPLNEVEFIGKTETLNYKKEVSVTDKIDETFVHNITNMVSEATTKSSGWTLSKEWNDIYTTQEEIGQLSEKSDERTTSEGKTVGGKYFVSNSEGGSTHISTESGGAVSNSAKVTTENSVGINASYDKTTEKYCEAKLGASNSTELSAGIQVPVSVAKVSAGVKNTTTVEGEIKNGRKDTNAFHVDGSFSGYVGTVNNNASSSYYNSSVNNSSTWNSTESYEQSFDTSHEESITNAIKEQISKTTTHNLSKALGEVNSETAQKEEQQMNSEEYSTSFTYGKGTQETINKTLEFNSSKPGYYRIITAGTVHVYAVVGYDVATASYYTYCYNVLDDTTREILDYSKDNMNFNDCENGVVTFEVPYEVNEYVAGFVGKTDGLEISYEGEVTGFVTDKDFDGTVVVPQYEGKNNEDGSYSAVKVTSFAASAFAGNQNIKTVVLPIYITEIPNGAFAGCTNLETVIAYGVTKIGTNAFAGCTSLKKFSVDNAITYLGEKAFEGVTEVAITAYDSQVADAAISCGAKNISVNISYIKDTYEDEVVIVDSDVNYFALIGNGGIYKNIRIESKAAETMISNMIFANNMDTPFYLASEKVTLARVTVENSPTFAMVLTEDQVALNLLGTVSLNATVENTVLSKSVTLGNANQSTTSKLVVNGGYLVCGEVTNKKLLNVEPTVINEEQFENYLVSSIVTFDANGGTVAQHSKTVYKGQPYGVLPIPEKQYFAFKGWYTEVEGGMEITADTLVDRKVDQTLYAHWEAVTATLLFDANGGQVDTSSKQVFIGECVGELPIPNRSHYTFNGWFTERVVGEQIKEDSVLTVAEQKTVYAQWTIVPYAVNWDEGTGYNISVSRTSSPNAEAPIGTLYNGAEIYYGDVLEISYSVEIGYILESSGETNIVVDGDVTSNDIYASVKADNYIYNIIYKSSNGTDLGNTTATYRYGTTNTIYAPAIAGYDAPGSQDVTWDSTSAKTITFTYTPTYLYFAQDMSSGEWRLWENNKYGVVYGAYTEFQNRTANSIQIRVVWQNTLRTSNVNTSYGYNQYFSAFIGGQSTGDVLITSSSTWASAYNTDQNVVAVSNWVTVPVSPTQTSVAISANFWDDNPYNPNKSWQNTVTIPTY